MKKKLIIFVISFIILGININAKEEVKFSPAFFEYHLKSQQNIESKINIINNSSIDLNYKISVEELDISLKESKNLVFVKNSYLKNIFNIVDEIIIPANRTISIPYKITIPNNFNSGGYYPVLLFTQNDRTEEGSLTHRIMINFYLDISSENNSIPKVEIKELKLSDLSINFFQNIAINYKNESSTFIKPTGYIEIYDKNNIRLPKTYIINEKINYLLQGQSITENFNIGNGDFKIIPDFGEYKIVVTLYADANMQKTILEKTFIVIPIFHIAFIILSIILIFLVILLIKKRIKKNKNINCISNKANIDFSLSKITGYKIVNK